MFSALGNCGGVLNSILKSRYAKQRRICIILINEISK